MGFAELMRDLMRERAMTGRGLARRLPCDPSLISRIGCGRQRPSARMARLLDELLRADGALVAAAESDSKAWSAASGKRFSDARIDDPGSVLDAQMPFQGGALAPDPDLWARIARAIERPEYTDPAVVAWLERCLDEHRRLDDAVGSGPVLDVVRAQLSAVARMARGAQARVADRLVDLLAQYAQFMAWLCNDSGDKSAALAWYDRAYDWAVEAGDASMAATALSMKAHLAWSVGDARRCVRFGEAARWHDDRTSPGVRGMAAQMVARGYALGGEADRAHRTLDEAESLILSASRRPDDEPPWMYFYGDTWFIAQRGMIEVELAERGNGDARHAVMLLESALKDLPQSYRRDRAWYGTMLARAHAAGDECDAAARTGLRFAADAMAVNRYAVSELGLLAVTLDQRGVRDARDLSEALADA